MNARSPLDPDRPTLPARLPGELWGVTAFFDPVGSALRVANLEIFCRAVREQGLRILVVELIGTGDRPRVDQAWADRVVRRRSDAVLWQKERLLNLGIEALPAGCDKVAWLDGDVLFENDDWVGQTARLLEESVVVQPYSVACWLPAGARSAPADLPTGLGEGRALPGMARAMASAPSRRSALLDYFRHGHTGFAWAARRSLLARHGLYDARVLGGGDVVIAHAIHGDEDFFRGRNPYCRHLGPAEIAHAARWGRALAADVEGPVAPVDGRVLHLWHGDTGKRNYVERLRLLRDIDFDPEDHLALDDGGCWSWTVDDPAFEERIRRYFLDRSPDPATAR